MAQGIYRDFSKTGQLGSAAFKLPNYICSFSHNDHTKYSCFRDGS